MTRRSAHRPSHPSHRTIVLVVLGALALLATACGSSGDSTDDGAATSAAADPTTTEAPDTTTTTTTLALGDSEVPDEATATAAAEGAQWADGVTITVADGEVRYTSNGVPDHAVLDGYQQLPVGDLQTVGEVAVDISVPLVPEVADTTTETAMGAIGVTLSGAVLFDPYEGDNTTVAYDDNFTIDGVPFIDDCGGHPAPPIGQYHYHGVPACTVAEVDTAGQHSVLLGYLLDGFAVYGPQGDDGDAPTDLDECSGHFGPTPEFPRGVYHYHLTDTAPYAPTCYHGTVDASATATQGPPGGGPGAAGMPGAPASQPVALTGANRYCHLAATPTAA